MKSLSGNKLLVDINGKPLSFSVIPSMPSEIRGEIRQHGGLVAKRSEDQSKVIKLIHHHYKGNDYCVSVKFVLDSIDKNELQDITQYEFNPALKGKDQPVLKVSKSDKKSKSPKKAEKRQKDEESNINASFLAPRSASTPSGTGTAAGVSLRSSKSAPSASSKAGRVHFETNDQTPSKTNVSPILDQPNLNKSPVRTQEVKVIISKSPVKSSSQNNAVASPSQPAQHHKDDTSKQFSENIPIERLDSYSSESSETLPPIRKLIEMPSARLSQPVPLPYTVSQLMNETLSLSQRIEDAKYLGMADLNVPDPNRSRKAPTKIIARSVAPQSHSSTPNYSAHGQQPSFTESSQKRKLVAKNSLHEVESLQANKLARSQPSGSPSKSIKIRSRSNMPIVNYPNSAQKTPVVKKPLVNYPKSPGSPTKSRPYNPLLDFSQASPNPLNMPSQTAPVTLDAKQTYIPIVTYSKSNPSTPLGERKKGSQTVRFQSSSQPVAVKTPRSELRYSSASQPTKNNPTPIRAKANERIKRTFKNIQNYVESKQAQKTPARLQLNYEGSDLPEYFTNPESANEFLDNVNFEQEWQLLTVSEKQQISKYWKKMDDFRAKMNCSKQKMQLALFMTNGKFAVAEKIIGNNFNIKCLSPQDQGLAFDKDLDEIILSKKPPFMIHGYDSSAVSERYMMLKPFQ